MNELEELARREASIREQALRATGLVEEKFHFLHERGVFKQSAAVHEGYVRLAEPPISSAEALKRAIFLGWYSVAEPGCFTGIGDLNEGAQARAQVLLEEYRSTGRIDPEFNVMLAWYWYIADYYFRHYSQDAVVAFLQKLEPEAYRRYEFTPADLQARGIMGEYWISVACRAA